MAQINFDAWRDRIRRETFANYHLAMAVAIQKEGNASAAIDAYRRALAEDPASALGALGLVRLLRQRGMGSEADATDRNALAYDAAYRDKGYAQEAGYLADAGDLDSAIALLDSAMVEGPSEILGEALGDVLVRRGQVDKVNGKPAAAKALFERAYAVAPHLFDTNYEFGSALAAEFRMADAEPLLARAMDIDPDHGAALANLANVVLHLGRVDDAEALFNKAKSKVDAGKATWIDGMLGIVAMLRGDPEGMIAAQRSVLERNSDFDWAYAYLGLGLQGKGEHELAEIVYRQVIAKFPQIAFYRSFLALSLLGLGRLDEALAECRISVQQSGDVWTLPRTVLGLVHGRQGDAEEALICHRRAVALQPELTWLHRMLLPWAMGDLDDAYRTLRFDPLNPRRLG